MNILIDGIRADREYGQLQDAIGKMQRARTPLPLLVTGLCEGASDAAVAALIRQRRQQGVKDPVLLICPEEKECLRLKNFLQQFDIRAAFFIARDLTFYNIVASHEYEHERLHVLSALLRGELDAVITTPDAALGYTIPSDVLIGGMLRLDYEETRVEPSVLAKRLTAAGYVRTEMVDAPGQFAVRGGIVDIFAPSAQFEDMDDRPIFGIHPLRIEFFGDEIDRMELFDPETQRMTVTLNRAELTPAREILLGEEGRALLRAAVSERRNASRDDRAREEMDAELAAIDGGQEIHFADKYITLLYPQRTSLLDYFGGRATVFMKGTSACRDRLKASGWHLEQTVQELMEGGTIAPKYTDYAKPDSAFELFMDSAVSVHFDSLGQGMSGRKLGGMFTFRSRHTVSYHDNLALLCEDLQGYQNQGYRTVVMAENEVAAKNLCTLLQEKGFRVMPEAQEGEFAMEDLPSDRIFVRWRQLVRGYELTVPRIAVLSTAPEGRDGALSVSGRLKTGRKKKSAAERILSYNDLNVGDFVVHEVHGIGQYMGIENLTVDGVSRDYITIRYAGSDKLFLPTDKLDMVSKFIGAHADDGTVKLSRFGGGEWVRAKARARAAVKDMAKELIALYAERMRKPGIAFPEDDELQLDFEAAFEYDETECQLDAIAEIKKDMMAPVPMDRLLCGDVGFGKTEVALRAAYKAVLGGKQVAILVPTTILALQHYQTISSRMRAFSVNVDMLSRFRTPKQQAQTLRRLKRGDVDVIVGTHRLIGKDIEFRDLGLLIVDEEQRFGVAQKEKLKQMAGDVDVLTLTATPIPRTLNMAMGGIRDISILDEAPGNRLPVQTYVLEYDELIVVEAIRRELRRGGQVFYLYNFVETIDGCAARLAHAIPEARITVAHGKMDKERLEDIWAEMLSGEIDILVCSTIIETGVDIPNANTLIVENANRLGLSQLHQLRGRVGRSARRAYAYFTYPRDKTVSEVATKRLEAIREYAEFGAGFKIAMRDMEIRGAGNMLGAEQHGHLEAIGYDLYIKLLNEAVLEEKGEAVPQRVECTLTLKCDAYLPDKYVPYPSQRMALYKKIATIETDADKEDIMDELIDRFGEPPLPARNLLTIAQVRSAAMKCGVTSVVEDTADVRIYPAKLDIDVWSELADYYGGGRLRIVMSENPGISFRKGRNENLPQVLYDLFCRYVAFDQVLHSEEETE